MAGEKIPRSVGEDAQEAKNLGGFGWSAEELEAEGLDYNPARARMLRNWVKVPEGRAENNDRAEEVNKASKAEKARTSHDYDFRNTNRYQEGTFLMASANNLVNSDFSDINKIDHVADQANAMAAKENTSVYDALKKLSFEANVEQDGYAATDLMNSFIDTTATYVVSREDNLPRGLAKGLMTALEMRVDSSPTDRENPYADELRVDFNMLQPIVNEFIEDYDQPYENPNAFREYLQNTLEIEEADLRSVKRRGERIDPDSGRRVQALKTALNDLEALQSNYESDLKNLRDSAMAAHRIIEN